MLFVSRLMIFYRKLARVATLEWETYQRFILAAALVAALLMRMWSMSQAAYHGVPVAALPFFGDQPGNAGQAVARVWTSYPFLYTCIPLVPNHQMTSRWSTALHVMQNRDAKTRLARSMGPSVTSKFEGQKVSRDSIAPEWDESKQISSFIRDCVIIRQRL